MDRQKYVNITRTSDTSRTSPFYGSLKDKTTFVQVRTSEIIYKLFIIIKINKYVTVCGDI